MINWQCIWNTCREDVQKRLSLSTSHLMHWELRPHLSLHTRRAPPPPNPSAFSRVWASTRDTIFIEWIGRLWWDKGLGYWWYSEKGPLSCRQSLWMRNYGILLFFILFKETKLFILSLRSGCAQHVRSQFPNQRLNLCPLHWEHSLNHWTAREVPEFFKCQWCTRVKSWKPKGSDTIFFQVLKEKNV